MQKKLLAVAVAGALALPASAMAVEVFGTIDTGLRNQSKIIVGAEDESELLVSEGQRTTNRWGFRGSEDLGGGLMANFWFEGQYQSDTGGGPVGGLFQRKNLVGLSKGGMSVDLGRDYTVNFKSQGIYDPMSYTYTGLTPAAGRNTQGVRFSNLVTAGFRFGTGGIRVDYTRGEVAGFDNGDGFGINGDFKVGPVTLTGAYSTVAVTDNESSNVMNVGGAYALGAFTIRAGWSNTEVEQAGGGETASPMFMLGLQYGFSPTLNGRVGYYNTKFEDAAGNETGTDKMFIVALDYYLSKRTTLYVNVDRRNIDGTATATIMGNAVRDGATGIGAGVVHAF
jgi:predicted porin